MPIKLMRTCSRIEASRLARSWNQEVSWSDGLVVGRGCTKCEIRKQYEPRRHESTKKKWITFTQAALRGFVASWF